MNFASPDPLTPTTAIATAGARMEIDVSCTIPSAPLMPLNSCNVRAMTKVLSKNTAVPGAKPLIRLPEKTKVAIATQNPIASTPRTPPAAVDAKTPAVLGCFASCSIGVKSQIFQWRN